MFQGIGVEKISQGLWNTKECAEHQDLGVGFQALKSTHFKTRPNRTAVPNISMVQRNVTDLSYCS
jgi:hypothetical protein